MRSAQFAGFAFAGLTVIACAQVTPEEDESSVAPGAQSIVDRAKLAYQAAQTAPIPLGDCASPELESALSGLEPVQREANASVDAALASANAEEREAALSLADSLNGLAIDGYLSIARKYSAAGCKDQAREIYLQIKSVYTGGAFVAARNEADQAMVELASTSRPAGYVETPQPIARPTATGSIPAFAAAPDTGWHPRWNVEVSGDAKVREITSSWR